MSKTRIKSKTPTAAPAPRILSTTPHPMPAYAKGTIGEELAALEDLVHQAHLTAARAELLAQEICGESGVASLAVCDVGTPPNLIAALRAVRGRLGDAVDRCNFALAHARAALT